MVPCVMDALSRISRTGIQIRNQPAHRLLAKEDATRTHLAASRMVSFKGEAESHPSLFATSETLNLLRFSRRYSCVQCLCEMVLEIFHDPIVIEQGIVDVVQQESGDAALSAHLFGYGLCQQPSAVIRASASFGPGALHGGDGVVVGTVDNHSGRRSAQSLRTPDVLRQRGVRPVSRGMLSGVSTRRGTAAG